MAADSIGKHFGAHVRHCPHTKCTGLLMSFEEDTTEAHERRITRCKSCRARIVWLKTVTARTCRSTPTPLKLHDEVYEHGRHVSHFRPARKANQHRKPR